MIKGIMYGLAYIEQAPVPHAKHKQIVIIDSLPMHKVAGVRERSTPPAPIYCCFPSIRRTLIRLSCFSSNLKPFSGKPLNERFLTFFRKVRARWKLDISVGAIVASSEHSPCRAEPAYDQNGY
jgi:hypothetical protein